MGMLSFVKKQFIDILQWTEAGDDVLAWRFPTDDFEIQQGGRSSSAKRRWPCSSTRGAWPISSAGDPHDPHPEPPVLTDLRNWDKLFESPIKSDVYFFSTRLRLNQTWGTANPLTIRDREFGAVRLRGFGATPIASPTRASSLPTSPGRATCTRWRIWKASSAARSSRP
jgi:hypothetical protein